ncbi:MAG: pitrilysin family protein, partial [Dehalococcoidia bacterium]|nr:pitrilysin family protein [Dehalococcoidia bacterium]
MEPISFEKITLDNGLDVILHQDTSLPIVAVNVWYHVGSKDEEPGKTGYAHLFEHLMFEGSKNHNIGYFEPLQEVGAILNGSTTPDRTNYWENLPSNYLELALWLESDRMGFLLDALDQRRFDIQRDVVKNERRQSYENRPYGVSSIHLQEATYPLPHPYHWPTIGFHEDLDAATLDDAKAFFQKFYTPSNASLAIAGDFQLEATRAMVERYFGDLKPGSALPRAMRTDSPLQGSVRLTLYDRVLLPRLSLVWPTIPKFHQDEAPLSILAFILESGKSSRLHRSLVYEHRIAQSVSVGHGPAEITGDFHVEVTAATGHTAAEVEETVLIELQRIRDTPPLPEELVRTKNRLEWQQVRLMASIGGFGGRANRLNSFNVFAGDPGLINSDLGRYLAVQPDDVSRVAHEYLRERQVQMVVLPE